jgi:hypothetical protein
MRTQGAGCEVVLYGKEGVGGAIHRSKAVAMESPELLGEVGDILSRKTW